MIKGLFKLVFGIIGTVIVVGLIVLMTFVIGHAVTGSWDIREWGKSESETSAIVTDNQNGLNTVSYNDYILNV